MITSSTLKAGNMEITIIVNGTTHRVDVEPRTLLVHLIRENLNLTGTHIGCDTSSCGACTVLFDGKSVKSCTILAVQANGKSVSTIEGVVGADGTLHPLAVWRVLSLTIKIAPLKSVQLQGMSTQKKQKNLKN